ncbi:hypothetical protein K488DRAFT_74400 [Vararia minispora EC-137]|uniref:Uncharacterized protein n=1 Tax=Vararia minispora EC-137 TaxID=1314806 RepID=A0ACB8Q7N6_9AGAM|nr:hypothetical protein K488DRAFT_74400 [Vararia minispora EC-137]
MNRRRKTNRETIVGWGRGFTIRGRRGTTRGRTNYATARYRPISAYRPDTTPTPPKPTISQQADSQRLLPEWGCTDLALYRSWARSILISEHAKYGLTGCGQPGQVVRIISYSPVFDTRGGPIDTTSLQATFEFLMAAGVKPIELQDCWVRASTYLRHVLDHGKLRLELKDATVTQKLIDCARTSTWCHEQPDEWSSSRSLGMLRHWHCIHPTTESHSAAMDRFILDIDNNTNAPPHEDVPGDRDYQMDRDDGF